MRAKPKFDGNKQGSTKHTFELTIKLNQKTTGKNEVCFQLYESGSPKGAISNCEIILYDDKICYVSPDDEKGEPEGKAKEPKLIDWFAGREPPGEAKEIWDNLITDYRTSLQKSEGVN